MPGRDFFREAIDKEFAAARAARAEGNDGKTRVAARRAAGLAIGWYLQETALPGWGDDAMTRLRRTAEEPSFPLPVREAAGRLTAKVSERFTYPFSADPLADAAVLVDFFLPVG